jgi:hypothetical protein
MVLRYLPKGIVMRKLAIRLPKLFFYLSLWIIFHLSSNEVQAQQVGSGLVDTSSWMKCADEDQLCAFSGNKNVRYGANKQFVYKDLVKGTLCSNSVFGDPIINVIKACYLLVVTVPEAPAKPVAIDDGTTNTLSWDVLADHYEVDIQLGGGAWLPDGITYTASPATWINLSAGSRIYRIRACNTEGVCSSNSPNSEVVVTAPPVQTWVKCSEEDQLCAFEGNKIVRYGANEQFVYKDLDDGTLCSNPIFGDPIVGVIKACYLLDVAAELPSDFINFNDYVLGAYGEGQDTAGSANIVNSGAGLELTGNVWKQINFPYTITANTVIEFDFTSSVEGEVHGIGFDTDTSTIDPVYSFQLYGNQNWGLNTYQNYASGSGVTHYRIPVGSHYTGAFSYLYFVMDEDTAGNTTANGTFSNVHIYEPSTEPTPDIPANAYYFLNPRWVGQAINIIGLADNTSIDAGGGSSNINAGETLTYTVQSQGETIFANKPFSIGTATDGLDMPVPSSFSGTKFVIPQIRESHYYYLLSPLQNTKARITVGANTQEVALVAGQVYRHTAGSSTEDAGIISADDPIFLSHSSATKNDRTSPAATTSDPYPVPPVATELWGIRTTNAYIAAAQDATIVQVWASNGSLQTIALNAGEIREVTAGLETSEGAGSAIHLLSDKPIAAIQNADSDGFETTAFLSQASFATDYIIPVDSQYVAIVCNALNTTIELRDTNNGVVDSAICNADGTNPGKAYFGSTTDGKHIAAGSKIVASQPIYLIYETAITSDEHNLLGNTPAPLIDISYPGSVDGESTNTSDAFIATATLMPGHEADIQTVEFSINGIDWFDAPLVTGVFQYDFGLLGAGNYTLQTRFDNHTTLSFSFTVEDEVVLTPAPVTSINLPNSSLVEVDFSVSWEMIPTATSYKLFIDNVEAQQLSATEAVLNLPIIGTYQIQVAACNEQGCSDKSQAQPIVIYHNEIDFNNYVIGPYAGDQGETGTAEIVEGGRGIRLQGNVWKQIPFNYTVSINTILSFDFVSTNEGEIHGIGLSPDLAVALPNTFQLFGDQTCCISTFKNYRRKGATQHYEIMIGQYFLGEYKHLFFVMDEDRAENINANGTFTAVRLYEEERVPPIATHLNVPTAVGINQSFVVTWGEASGALSYKINVNGQTVQTVEQAATSLNFDTPGDYMVGVQACNDYGCNVEAQRRLVQVLSAPGKVNGLNVPEKSIVQGQGFTVVWNSLNDARYYQIYLNSSLQAAQVTVPSASLNLADASGYGIQVQACNQFGCGEISDIYSVTILSPPAAIGNVNVALEAATATNIPLSWPAVNNADYYEIVIDGQRVSSGQTTASTLSFSQAGNYAVKVRGCNLAGCGDYCAPAFVAVQALPKIVFDITVASDRRVGEAIAMSWLPVANASYYKLYLNDSLQPQVNSSQTQILVGSAGVYQVQIEACSQLGCGPLSSSTSLSVGANLGPVAADTALTFTQQSAVVQQDLAQLVADANGIDWNSLQLVKPALGQVSVNGSQLSIDYSSVHLVGTERLEYTVSDLLGAPSNKGFIDLQVSVLQTPELPTQLSIDELAPSEQLLFGWQLLEEEDIRYQVEHQLSANPWQLIHDASSEHQAIVSLPLNGSHRFRVKACIMPQKLCSEYAQSDALVVASIPRPIANILSPTVEDQNKIRLQWLASSNATHYVIEQQHNQQGWQPLLQDVVGTLLMLDVADNGQYQFKILACNNVGCSQPIVSQPASLAYKPASPAVVTRITAGAKETLSWSEVPLADWYVVQTIITDQWQGVNGAGAQTHYQLNSLTLNPKPAGDIRVQACNSVGCSTDPTLAVQAKVSETPIDAFYAANNVLVRTGYNTSIHWQVNDAANLSIVSDNGNQYANLAAVGSLMVAPEQSTHYSLNAQAYPGAQTYSQSIEVVVMGGDDYVISLPNNPMVSPIVSSIMVEANGNRCFGDLQGSLIDVDSQGNILWQQDNVGTLYSPPVRGADNKMYYTATDADGKGKFCRIDNQGASSHCVSLAQPIIGGPIIDGNRALIVDLYGGVSSVNLTSDAISVLGSLPANKQVRSTSVLTPQNKLIVRTTANDIYMLDLDIAAGTIGWTQTLAGEQQ